MDKPTDAALTELLGAEKLDTFIRLTECVIHYMMFKDFGIKGSEIGSASINTDGAEKPEAQRDIFSEHILALYDTTVSYHDGKRLRIPIDNRLSFDDIVNMLKIKRKPNRK